MTAAIFRGRRLRAAATVGAVAFGLVALSACDKPTPLATVTVGSKTVTTEAACYNDGESIETPKVASCLKEGEDKTVKAAMEDKIRFGVDPKIADKGWTIFINDQAVEPEPNNKTFRSIPASAFFSTGQGPAVAKTKVSIVEAASGKALGVWNFTLERDAG
ncbi:DUF2771 domain-containing protein [Streptomyces cinnamoneus]|uniref:DUF2771 domain-containing protein n=1 Tax=Streptomyces cinnamoneus TaxID=53446 RepID=A0A2G1XC80_STRCJ|nr:DUF2771 domain-containing protein [Streptomyces cinnamoneus]PHQ48857.1 DUF2771 domain-containing protein [Streptomyces cinnamoneus]PPT14496.1 DUF2771 domain-containing protein [Streptomyces cinnamoneus]